MDKTTKLLNTFNKRANDWLQELEGLTDEQLYQRPAENSWNMSLLFDHITKVARTYQIHNFQKTIRGEGDEGKRKNFYAYGLFDLNLLPNITIRMENFPQDLVNKFTPVQRDKADSVKNFKAFIQEVNVLEPSLRSAKKSQKGYHGMFGKINPYEWFSLIDIHMRHHEKQRTRIRESFSQKEFA